MTLRASGNPMRFTARRIRQILIGILAVMSMSVTSIAACACTHHGQKAEPETKSCHSAPSGDAGHHKAEPNEEQLYGTAIDESCVCMSPAVDSSVKAETFKFKMQPTSPPSKIDIELPALRSSLTPSRSIRFSEFRPQHFDRATSTRGPPSF